MSIKSVKDAIALVMPQMKKGPYVSAHDKLDRVAKVVANSRTTTNKREESFFASADRL